MYFRKNRVAITFVSPDPKLHTVIHTDGSLNDVTTEFDN